MRQSRAALLATLAALASGWDSSSRMIWSEPLADPAAAAAAAPSAPEPNDHGVTPHVRKIVDKMLRMTPDPSETMNSFQKFATTANVDLATARRFEPIEASVRMHSDSMAMMAGYLTSVKVRAASTDGDRRHQGEARVPDLRRRVQRRRFRPARRLREGRGRPDDGLCRVA